MFVGHLTFCAWVVLLCIGGKNPVWWGTKAAVPVFFSALPSPMRVLPKQGIGVWLRDPDKPAAVQGSAVAFTERGACGKHQLVTPTHYTPSIAAALGELRDSRALTIPVAYNTSSFDSLEALLLMKGKVDVYLADFKYASALEAGKLSHAPRYPEIALAAIEEMVAQVPVWEEDDEGLLLKGVIVRHLVLPGRVEESKRALATLHERFGGNVRLSIMSQYTPLASGIERYGLAGRVTEEEYEAVLDYADSLGIEDYFWQQGDAAQESFVPDFNGEGVR